MAIKTLAYMTTFTSSSATANEFRDNRQLRRKTTAQFIPPMKAVYTEEEAFEILFPDERSKQTFREEKARMDRNLLDNIRTGRVNPIRGWRILKGMDQKAMVKVTGISQPNLSRLEKKGAPTPTVATLRKIAAVLGVSIEDLIHDQ
ncbi:MAG: helix-turn-helix transcriptional regulator [Deltaproteobacteria bacterium]|nr:helix-turn-helix transcriptional regulator [Deltaproteobacteria bacterium]